MSATPARVAALRTLRSVRRGVLADRALARAMASLEARERAWLQELVYGTLRLRGRLDHALATRVRRGLDDLEPDVLDVLRLGAYQLLEMGSVPPYAAVSQSVELAKRVSRASAGLVNGVLKALSRGEPVAYPALDADPMAHLATWGSHPRWLVERWIDRFGVDGAHALVEWNNARPDVFLRPLGVEAEAALAALRAVDVDAAAGPPGMLRLAAGADVSRALAAVPAVVQDPGAARVAAFAARSARGHVADLCAAPGGKTLALALAPDVRYVLAADRSARRMRGVRENRDRVARQLDRPLPVGVAVADARRPAAAQAQADMVLLDVPCTGTGTLRRHPDARWRVQPQDLAALTALQRDMLDGTAPLVRPGGLLVYATCSLEPEENDEQVDAFLARNPAFEPAPGRVGGDAMNEKDRLVMLPQRDGTDGAFAARLRRVA